MSPVREGFAIENSTIALKEWASVIGELLSGGQILVMRKGGILEETKEFQLRSRSFYLYPTYEHQKKDWLQDVYRGRVDETIVKGASSHTVSLSAYAEAVEDLEIRDQDELDRLSGFHMFTPEYAVQRFRWKPAKPLHVLLLRVYKLEPEAAIPVLPAYGGCKSWLELGEAAPQETGRVSVLADEAFEERRTSILRALGRESAKR